MNNESFAESIDLPLWLQPSPADPILIIESVAEYSRNYKSLIRNFHHATFSTEFPRSVKESYKFQQLYIRLDALVYAADCIRKCFVSGDAPCSLQPTIDGLNPQTHKRLVAFLFRFFEFRDHVAWRIRLYRLFEAAISDQSICETDDYNDTLPSMELMGELVEILPTIINTKNTA
jgi:hypothetical protein